MASPIFTGSGVAIITPFTETGVDYEKLGELIDFQIEHNTDALVICGTTGEASTMPDSEHLEVIRYAVEKTNKRIPVIAGVGSNDTKHAVHLSKEAEKAGSDALLHVTPYYNKANQEGLYQHFKIIAESVSIPIILYNVPSRTGLNIAPDTVARLSGIENIVGLKECNLSQVGSIVNKTDDSFSVYSGEDGNVLPLLSLGGKGVISVMANIIPRDTHKMVVKFLNGDIDASTKLQLKALDLIEELFNDVNPIPVKAACNLLGMNVGIPRMPLLPLTAEKTLSLKNALIKYGLEVMQ
jgi:4-hydroxy-tetrahydrodipicolinate synthase